MEYRITHKGLLGFENFGFTLDLVKLTKSAKNRSYPNLSNCCHEPVKIRKYCPTCNETVDTKSCTHKGFKLGKETFAVSAEHLKSIKDNLNSDKIIIDEFRQMHEIPGLWFTDQVFAAKQNKKYIKEYVEYSKILSQAGMVGIGQAIFRNRPYPIMVYPYQDRLMVRALHFFDEVEPIPALSNKAAVNETKIGLMLKAVQLNVAKEPFSMGRFVNQREEAEEKLIEMCLKGEALPEVKREEMQVVNEYDEIARLQELIKKQEESITQEIVTTK